MILLDYFGFLVEFMEKGTKSINLGNFGVLRCSVRISRSSVAEREAWTSLGYAEVEQSYVAAKVYAAA